LEHTFICSWGYPHSFTTFDESDLNYNELIDLHLCNK
jgi:hypothetical protein